MKIILSKQEAEQYFYNALCNGLNYFLNGYGFSLSFFNASYDKALKTIRLKQVEGEYPFKQVCYEDVLMQILRQGDSITFVDIEGEGDNTITVTMDMIHKRVCKAAIQHLVDMANEEDDCCTADAIIQSVLYNGEMIFG